MTCNNNGFCVPYTVRVTPDKGKGIFAAAQINKGTILWRFVRGQYKVYDERSLKMFLAALPHSEVVYELEHIFGTPEFPGYMIRVLDDGVLVNHSDQPTIAVNNDFGNSDNPYWFLPKDINDVEEALLDDHFSLVAIQGLNVGDELTHDYNVGVEDPPYYDDLCEQYNVPWDWME